jgi:AcrR family transcriptional regulator
MTDQKRRYRMTKRAASEQATRRRITESAVHLHSTLGPARTPMSAVAEHAGVRRSTLYRHFPDEAALMDACSAHWMDSNPVPGLDRWAETGDPDDRLRFALEELYAYYRSARHMMENLLRDETISPLVAKMFSGYHEYTVAAREVLMAGRRAPGRAAKPLRAAIGHALAFATWRSLAVDQELDDAEAADVMCRLVGSVAARGRRRAGYPAARPASVPAGSSAGS